MSHSQLREHSDTSVSYRGADKSKAEKKQRWTSIGLQILAMIGMAVLLYPQAADWAASLGHNSEVSGYVRQVEGMPEAERLKKLNEAREYNMDIPRGVLRDPYTRQLGDDDTASDQRYHSYLEQLNVGDGETIGEISYPSLGISLPLYHGTADEMISKGVGHLYGSSLPVGGPSTHAVMTSHSGLVNASLFTKLPEAQIGDVFTVTVLGETHHYEVRNLETVLPHEAGSLQVIDGEDWVTLLTCTPIGINSHRFLVQAERIPAPAVEGIRTIAGDGLTTGIPWWLFIFLAGSVLTAYLIFGPSQKKNHAGRHRLGKPRDSHGTHSRVSEDMQ